MKLKDVQRLSHSATLNLGGARHSVHAAIREMSAVYPWLDGYAQNLYALELKDFVEAGYATVNAQQLTAELKVTLTTLEAQLAALQKLNDQIGNMQ